MPPKPSQMPRVWTRRNCLRTRGFRPFLMVGKYWSGRRDSNPRPQPWQGCALPLSYTRSRDRCRSLRGLYRSFACSCNMDVMTCARHSSANMAFGRTATGVRHACDDPRRPCRVSRRSRPRYDRRSAIRRSIPSRKARRCGARFRAPTPRTCFSRTRRARLFLVVAPEDAVLELKHLHRRIGASGRLSFGKPDLLARGARGQPGSVTPFGLINDKPPRVTVVLDAALMAERDDQLPSAGQHGDDDDPQRRSSRLHPGDRPRTADRGARRAEPPPIDCKDRAKTPC